MPDRSVPVDALGDPADALQASRLIPDTPAHEGVERDRAKVQSGPGGN